MRRYAVALLKSVSIRLRVARQDLILIDIAAKMQRTHRAKFILDAACRRAEEVILDANNFVIAGSAFELFEAALESDSLGNSALVSLLQRPSRWG